MRRALSIAGSDCSGGAGIQADLKTMLVNGVYAMSAVTALTAQNTAGVRAVAEVSPEFLGQQLDAVFEDIYPQAVKVGMVVSAPLIRVIAQRLALYRAKNIVVDPVMAATSGSALMKQDAAAVLCDRLLPLASLITPNIPEAEYLAGVVIRGPEDMERAAKRLGDTYRTSVLLKGGHSVGDPADLLYAGGQYRWFPGRRIDNPNGHGTGCTLSAAIAANLAKGFGLGQAVKRAKEYVSGVLGAMLDLGKGPGPLHHGFYLEGYFMEEP